MDASALFGEVISSYSRAQAIEDGVLIDVTGQKGSEYFKAGVSVALTSAVNAELARGQGSDPDTFAARLWDVCYMSKFGQRILEGTGVKYRVKVGRRLLTLHSVCGPNDDGSPCITIGFPTDF